MKTFTLLLLVTVLSGCASFPPTVRGTFDSRNQRDRDFIVIQRDGSLHWSPMAKTRSNKLVRVGHLVFDKNDPKLLRVSAAPGSEFRDVSLRFSEDYDRVTVDWRRAGQNRSTEYERTTTK